MFNFCGFCFSEGNNFFKNKQYPQAIEQYSVAISHDPSDVTFYSNRRYLCLFIFEYLSFKSSARILLLMWSTWLNKQTHSACYAAIDDWEKAAEDGKSCIVTNRTFVKGYFRAGLALQKLGNLEAAQDVVKRGLGIESGNADLKRMNRELEEAMRVRRVEQAVEQGRKQLRSKEINEAFKTVDAGLRLDPSNSQLNALMNEIKPLRERAEKQRVSGLDRTERIKEEGDNAFKAAQFESAIESYTKCIDALRDDVSFMIRHNCWLVVLLLL